MTIYKVQNEATGYFEEFTTLTAAKKAMREHNAGGWIEKSWANGDWENLGEIRLRGHNRHLVANTRQRKAGY